MAKGQKRSNKEPKKAAVDKKQAKKEAGPKYLRGTTTTTPGDLRTGRPGAKS